MAKIVKSKPGTVEWISSEWTAKLATLTTVLGRLQLLSSLRDPHTGTYVHHGMSLSIGNQTHEVLLKSHKDAFAEWQAMGIREQMQDLNAFVSSLPQLLPDGSRSRTDRDAKNLVILETWAELEPYRNFVPRFISKLDKDLFLINLSSIVSVFKNQLEKDRDVAAESTDSEETDQ